MTSISSVRNKIADLKAKVEQSSISPLLLGSILDEMVDLVNIVDPSSIKIIPAADSVRISFSVDGSPSTIIIPAVSTLAAGVITPDQINSIREEIANAVNAAKTPTISPEQLDTMGTDGSAAALRALVRGAAHHTRYRVKDNIYSAATLDITSDSMGHLLTQILTSHYSLGPDGQPDFSSHDDNAIHTLWRSFNLDAPSYYPVPKGQWSRWQELTPAGLEQRTAALEQSASDLGNRTAAVEKAVASIPVPPKVYPFDGIWDSGSLPSFGVWYHPGADRFYCSTLQQGYHDSDYNQTVGIDSSRRIARRDCLFTCDGNIYAWEESLGRLVAQSELHRSLSSAIATESGRISELEESMPDLAMKQFILLWEEACTLRWSANNRLVGGYDPESDPDYPFYIQNTRFNYTQAVRCYHESFNYWTTSRHYQQIQSKTLLPIRYPYEASAKGMFSRASALEILYDFRTGEIFAPNDARSAFEACSSLRRIEWPYAIAKGTKNDNVFKGCSKLEWVTIYYLHESISFSDSPLLTLDMMQQLASAKVTGAFTPVVTLHPDVYAKLTGDISNAAAAAITGDELKEWMTTLEAILANNITIAC